MKLHDIFSYPTYRIPQNISPFLVPISGVLAVGAGGPRPPPPAGNSWGAQKWKGGADPEPNFEIGGKKRIWKNIVTSTKKKCVYRLINKLSA